MRSPAGGGADPSNRGVLRVFLPAIGPVGTEFFGGLWRFGGFQNFIVDTAANCCFITLTGVGFMPMMSTPNHFDEGVPPKTRILLGIKGGIALSLAPILVLTLTQFDLRWLVEKLRPWLDREASIEGGLRPAPPPSTFHQPPKQSPQTARLRPRRFFRAPRQQERGKSAT